MAYRIISFLRRKDKTTFFKQKKNDWEVNKD
jgi:hypothetical protein